ncbi:MAG: hypothetical protein HZB53_19365 [Chloroflexi bacterium]|nr:hypothetical protein [Chloroflexota bacterium]
MSIVNTENELKGGTARPKKAKMPRTNLLVFCTILMVAGTVGSFSIKQMPEHAAASNSTDDHVSSASGQIIYLASLTPGASPFSRADFEAEGVRVVSSLAEARVPASPAIAAIIVDHVTLAEAEPAWLTDQYRGGVVIVGLNVNMNELLRVLPPPANDPSYSPLPWGQGYAPGRPHYSIIDERGKCWQQTQDHFDRPDLKPFMQRLRTRIQSRCNTP